MCFPLNMLPMSNSADMCKPTVKLTHYRVLTVNHTFGLIKGMHYPLKLECLCCYGDGSLKNALAAKPLSKPIQKQSSFTKKTEIS